MRLDEILNKVLTTARVELDLELHKLWEHWPHVVGNAIADNAHPAVIKGGLLLVHVSSSPWLHELQYLKIELIEKLNTALGKKTITEIRFKIGPLKSTN